MKLADYSDRVTADQLDTALRLGGFEGVFHYLAGTPFYVVRIEDPTVVADIRARRWPQAGIDTPTLATVDGAASAARVRQVYGFGDGFRHYLDIEPSQFDANPGAWPVAADGWCDAIRAAGLSPGVYGTDQTLAACSSHADSIWRIAANTGTCDPAAPGKQGLNSAFFAGRRIVQCETASYNGVSFDVNYSQFSIGGEMSLETERQVNELFQLLVQGLPQADGQGGIGWIKVGIDQLLARPVNVNVNALAAALAPLLPPETDPNVIATAVLQHLSKATAAG